MITAPAKSLSFGIAVALLSFAVFVSILAAGGVMPACRRIRSACRTASPLAARLWHVLGDVASLALLWWAAGRHAGGRVLPEPALDPCPWEPAGRPASGGAMPAAWHDPNYISPAEQRDMAARPTQTYDIEALLAAAHKEAHDELEAWWLA
jgi:hypothetical protein